MGRLLLRPLRRCRVLFALALCAWLGLASTAFAKVDCCAGMGGMAAMGHHHDAPGPSHAAGVHVDCSCAHTAATLPAFALPAGPMQFAAMIWRPSSAFTPEPARAPPLRPPLA